MEDVSGMDQISEGWAWHGHRMVVLWFLVSETYKLADSYPDKTTVEDMEIKDAITLLSKTLTIQKLSKTLKWS